MKERKGKCTNFGNCATADTQEVITVPAGKELICPACGKALTEITSAAPSSSMPKILAIVAIVVVLAVAGAAFAFKDRILDLVNPKPPADARTFSYVIQTVRDGEPTFADDKVAFRSGDKFRLFVKSTFPGYLYVFNENADQPRVKLLYPDANTLGGAKIDVDSRMAVPQGDDAWMVMDQREGTEELVVLASTVELKQFQNEFMPREDFSKEMDNIAKNEKVAKVIRSKDGDWTQFAVNHKDDNGVVVARLKLQHK